MSLGNRALVTTIRDDFKLSEVVADKIMEMLPEEKMLRDELTQTDIVGEQ